MWACVRRICSLWVVPGFVLYRFLYVDNMHPWSALTDKSSRQFSSKRHSLTVPHPLQTDESEDQRRVVTVNRAIFFIWTLIQQVKMCISFTDTFIHEILLAYRD
jgi:hypothetical protein